MSVFWFITLEFSYFFKTERNLVNNICSDWNHCRFSGSNIGHLNCFSQWKQCVSNLNETSIIDMSRREDLDENAIPRKRARIEESSRQINVRWRAQYTCTKCRLTYRAINLMKNQPCLCPSCLTTNVPDPGNDIARKHFYIHSLDRYLHSAFDIDKLLHLWIQFQLTNSFKIVINSDASLFAMDERETMFHCWNSLTYLFETKKFNK